MDELELLKKDWNKESVGFKEYSEKDIYNMIKNKSVSVTRTLLFIGLIEVSLWSLYGYLDQEFPYVRIAMFIVFTGSIIFLFNRMKTEQNSISLMRSILNLRRLILGYACISLILLVTDNILHFDHNVRNFMAGFKEGQRSVYDKGINTPPINPDTIVPVTANYIIFGIVLLITFYLLYRVYKRTYGKILQDLRKNYKELSYQDEKKI